MLFCIWGYSFHIIRIDNWFVKNGLHLLGCENLVGLLRGRITSFLLYKNWIMRERFRTTLWIYSMSATFLVSMLCCNSFDPISLICSCHLHYCNFPGLLILCPFHCGILKMEDGSYDGIVRVPPTLPPGVAACEGISCALWFSKRVILRITSRADVEF